jgi:hypothetical protein
MTLMLVTVLVTVLWLAMAGPSDPPGGFPPHGYVT